MKDVSKKEAGASESSDSLEKRRVPRLALGTEQFRLASNGKIFPVVDLSTEGMSLRIIDEQDLVLFPVGTALMGTLNLRRQKYPVKAKVRNLGRDRVGCEFEPQAGDAGRALAAALDPAQLGQALKPMPASESGLLWFQGPSDTNAMFWRQFDGVYVKALIFALGFYVQWDEEQGLTTGVVKSSFEPGETRGVIRLETLEMERDAKVSPQALLLAKTLVMSSNLSQDLKGWCMRRLVLPQ